MKIIVTIENLINSNLGVGLGNKNDYLFTFKSGFSSDFRTFKV
ncbi:MAG TPA: hypothetical protein VKN36_11880 [Eudoraea sp.]|nr:hypothetical protein [Eudoraea sp.]